MLSFEDRTCFPIDAVIFLDHIPRSYRVFEYHVLSNIPNTDRFFELSQHQHHRTQDSRIPLTSLRKRQVSSVSPLRRPRRLLQTSQHLPDPVETAIRMNIHYATTSTLFFMSMPPLAISRQPAHSFSPARPLRAQRKVAGGGGDVVFLLGPILTDLASAQSFATTNALYPATRFGTDDGTTMMETRDAFRESEWRWLRRVEQRLTVFPSWKLGQGRRGRWHGNKARPFEVGQEIMRDLVGLDDVEAWTSKLSWTRSAVIFIRLGATLGDDHGEVEERLFGQRDNARYSSWAVVGTRVSSWAEFRSRFSSRSSSGRFLGFLPKSLDLLHGVGVKHSEGHLVLSHSYFRRPV